MLKVLLKDVTDQNRDACLALSLANNQDAFIPDVAAALEIPAAYPDARPLAIYNESEVVIGFALYGIDENTGNWKIFRLMIDQAYQGKGYGTAATREIIDILKTQNGATTILICYHEDNQVAKHLYKGFGFEEYGQDGTKVLARLG